MCWDSKGKWLGKLRVTNTSFEITKLSWAFWLIFISPRGIEIYFFSKSLLKKKPEISSYISSSLVATSWGFLLGEIINLISQRKDKKFSRCDNWNLLIEIVGLFDPSSKSYPSALLAIVWIFWSGLEAQWLILRRGLTLLNITKTKSLN